MWEILQPLFSIVGIVLGVALLALLIVEIVLHRRYNVDYQWEDGSYYQGQVNHFGINGDGVFVSNIGDRYEGQFRKNVFNGKGVYSWDDGRTFDGLFKDGKPFEGKYTDERGNIYRCRFVYFLNGTRKTEEFTLIQRVDEDTVELGAGIEDIPKIIDVYLDGKHIK